MITARELDLELKQLSIRVAEECKSIRTLLNGNLQNLAELTTNEKKSIVKAINELNTKTSISLTQLGGLTESQIEDKILELLPDPNLPSGGTTGQILKKTNNQDYQVGWVDPPPDTSTLFQRVSDLENSSSYFTWDFLVANWSVQPTLTTSITGGDVYTYVLDGVTRYRFVPTIYDSTQDSFYSGFDGTNLTGLIVTRG